MSKVFLLATNTGIFDSIVNWIVNLMNTIGAPGVGIGIAAENLFPPIPSEALLPLAGFSTARPDASFTLFEAILWATIGSVFGAAVLYYIGVLIGHDRMVKIATKIPLVNAADITKTTLWFRKHGAKAVFFGRMLPIFRSLISIPAGIERMPLPKFLLLTAAGSAIWNTVFILAGFWLGDRWEIVSVYVDRFQYLIIAAVAATVAAWVIMRIRKLRKQRRNQESCGDNSSV